MSDTDAAATSGHVSPPSRRDLLIGGTMALAAGVAYAREPHTRLASIAPDELEKIVPLEIGPWRYETASGIVLPPPDALAKMLYDQQMARAYASDSQPGVMLVMAYGSGQNGALQVHRPEICYPASGFRLSDKRGGTMALGNGTSIPVRSFTAIGDVRTEQVLYWSRIADVLPTGWTAQRVAIMRNNLMGYIPDGLLVRVSVISPDREGSLAKLGDFCRAMLAASGAAGRRKLIGTRYA